MRKKITLAFIIISLMGLSKVNAQRLAFGVFGESQLTWLTSDTKAYKSDGATIGFNAGFALEKYFAERYAITTGASIASMGGNILFNNSGDTIKTLDGIYTMSQGESAKIKGQYISVPLGLKFKTNEIGYTTFYAALGLKANVAIKGYTWINEQNVDREVLNRKHYNFAFISYFINAGIQYSLGGPSSIQAGLTFTNNLTNPLRDSYSVLNIGTTGIRVGLIF